MKSEKFQMQFADLLASKITNMRSWSAVHLHLTGVMHLINVQWMCVFVHAIGYGIFFIILSLLIYSLRLEIIVRYYENMSLPTDECKRETDFYGAD